MTVSYILAPEPFWVIINNEGTVAGGAKMYTRRNDNKVVDKPVYTDATGHTAWTNPIVFDANGVQGPFYWVVDSSAPNDSYYIFVQDADGNPLWDIVDFAPPGSGGGGNTTVYQPIINFIANNQFIDHIANTASPIGLTDLVIAPANHKGFTPVTSVPISTTLGGVVGPDTRFMKNSTINTDQITFEPFIFGDDPLINDVTPVDYVRYRCTTANPGETYKLFQFPITQKVKNLNTKAFTFMIWARVNVDAETITPALRQYFGSSPTASAEVITPLTPINLTTTWTQHRQSFTASSLVGKTLGTAGETTDDDAIYLQLNLPLDTTCDIWFTKPKLYLGDVNPESEFTTYDQFDAIDQSPRTGYVQASYLTTAPPGWVAMNDGSIGDAASNATTRNNKDTFQLYKTIWDGVSNANAPTQDSAGMPTGRGASAVADFVAHKRLVLPLSLGREMAGAGNGAGLTARLLGSTTGIESTTLVQANLPSPFTGNISATNVGVQTGGTTISAISGAGTVPVTFTIADANVAFTNMPPTSFRNIYIKL